MYSEANLSAILPSLMRTQIHSNCCNNGTHIFPPTAFLHPYLLSPSMMPSKSQILAEMEAEYQKLRFLETLLYASPTGYLSNSTPTALSLSSIPQQQPLQYPITTSMTPPKSSHFYSSTTSTPISMIQTNEIKKIKKSPSHSVIPGSSSPTSSTDRPHQCNECGKTFRFKSNLFEHKSLHSSEKTYQFICPFCSKSCRLKGNLKKHLQIHMGTAEQLEKFWKARFSRSSGRPRKVVSLSNSLPNASESSRSSPLKDFLINVPN